MVGVTGPGCPHRVQAVPLTIPASANAETTAKNRRANQGLFIAPTFCRVALKDLGESRRALLKR
jgi:hypothetical protein